LPAASRLQEQVEHEISFSKKIWTFLRYQVCGVVYKLFMHGSSVDIHARQRGEAGTKQGDRMQAVYARAKQYPNETEHLFSFLQVMTACTASFAHGANDLSNAIGPFSVIYSTWHTGQVAGKSVPVEVWMLVFGAATLVLGLWTFGYNIMIVLGNRITLHSPSRGFTMELGASLTVILASQYGIPVSTTMCITGATVGTSLCSGDLRSTNWRAIAWIYLGWIMTIIIVMTASACSLAIILNAPNK
jgi:sodium-dependent phosphate transporter